MNSSEQHRINHLKEKEDKIKSNAEKESVKKQRTMINREIQDVEQEYEKIYKKSFKTINKITD